MKRLIYILPLYLFTLLPLCTSCSLETSNNGDLDGMWLMQSVDTLSTGGTADVREDLIRWSFQVHMMQLRHPKRVLDFHFQHEGNLLILKDPVIDDRMEGDPVVTDVEVLREVGLSQLKDTFIVVDLTDEELYLSNKEYLFYFRKF